MMRGIFSRKKQAGFTIIELMISLSILSVILLASSVIMMQIGRLYNKGVNQATLQNTNRNVVAEISNQLQLSGSTPSSVDATTNAAFAFSGTTPPSAPYPSYSVCIDNTRFSFMMDRTMGKDLANGDYTPHVLWRDTMHNTGSCPALDLSVADPTDAISNNDGTDLLGNRMLLTHFVIKPVSTVPGAPTDVYAVEVWLAYGDGDLGNLIDDKGHARCKGGSASQFCAVSEISTSVTRRLAGS